MAENPVIKFMADRVIVNGPNASDGSYKITFIVGEYQVRFIKDLVGIYDKNMAVGVKILDDTEKNHS